MHGLSPSPPRQQNGVQINPDIPAYIVVEKRGFFDDSDRLWEKLSMIYWEGEPNPGFEPLNELGEEKLREYFTKLDGLAHAVSKKNGTAHASLVNAYESRRRLDEMDRKSGRSIDREDQMPIMGGRKYEKQKATSVHDAAASLTPIMGHQGRYSVAQKQAQEGRNAVNKDDKGL